MIICIKTLIFSFKYFTIAAAKQQQSITYLKFQAIKKPNRPQPNYELTSSVLNVNVTDITQDLRD
jgi:hypothetical protein